MRNCPMINFQISGQSLITLILMQQNYHNVVSNFIETIEPYTCLMALLHKQFSRGFLACTHLSLIIGTYNNLTGAVCFLSAVSKHISFQYNQQIFIFAARNKGTNSNLIILIISFLWSLPQINYTIPLQLPINSLIFQL